MGASSMAVESIEEFLEQIRKCRDWDICSIPSPDTPLVEGLNSARILLVSQAPSDVAWEARTMFGKENYTYDSFIDFFAVDESCFSSLNFVWIQTGNCYPGKHEENPKYDAIPEEHCAQKFFPMLRPLLKDFDLIIISGRNAARRWAEVFQCGWNPNDSLNKIVSRRFTTDGVSTDVIHNPSGASYFEQKYPDQARRCKELVRQKIAKVLSGITVESDEVQQQPVREETEPERTRQAPPSPVAGREVVEISTVHARANQLFEWVMEDTDKLMQDVRGEEIAKQLVRSAGSVCANLERGLAGASKNELVRLLGLSKGSALQMKGWYKRSSKFLSPELISDRVNVVDEIISMLADFVNSLGRRKRG
jgi:four helix bundle protein